mgnify:CR=1 FL=1
MSALSASPNSVTPYAAPALDPMRYQWPTEGPSRAPYWTFTDPMVYAREQERIFRGKAWHYVGLEAEVANPGDFKATQIGESPVLITRGEDGKVYGMLNRCAHRGNLVLPASAHPAFNKAALLMDLEVRRVPVDDEQLLEALQHAVRARVDASPHPRRVEPDRAHGAGAVLEGGLGPGLRTRRVPHRGHFHAQRRERRFAALAERHQFRHRSLAAVLLVAHREVAQQVAGGRDPQVPERGRRARPDAGQRLDRRRRTQFRVRHVGGPAPGRIVSAWHGSPSTHRSRAADSSTRRAPPSRRRLPRPGTSRRSR